MVRAALPHVLSSAGFTIYLFAISIVLALLEIQIEGAKGWASDLPTWRLDAEWVLRLTSGKAVTGYHVWFNSLLILFLHLPFWFVPWNWASEFSIVGIFFLLAVQWDFLWFVLNPHFGLSRFSKEHVWWFRRWIWGIPGDYYIGLILSFLSWMLAAILEGERPMAHASRWVACVLTLAALTICAVLWAGLRRRTRPVKR
jgi:hypothetical protein